MVIAGRVYRQIDTIRAAIAEPGPRLDGDGRRPTRTRPPERLGPSAFAFPDPRAARADGLIGVGADLSPETLVAAYRSGIFPWPWDDHDTPWFSPDPRAVLPLDRLHISRSLRRTLRRSDLTATVDRSFAAVIDGCADRQATWITRPLRDAYVRLHELGHAHSVEIREDGRLVAGLYGVQVGGLFCAESKFGLVRDASKVAVVELVKRFAEAGGGLIDVQQETSHVTTLGATTIPRSQFLDVVSDLRDDDVRMVTDERPVCRLGCEQHRA